MNIQQEMGGMTVAKANVAKAAYEAKLMHLKLEREKCALKLDAATAAGAADVIGDLTDRVEALASALGDGVLSDRDASLLSVSGEVKAALEGVAAASMRTAIESN